MFHHIQKYVPLDENSIAAIHKYLQLHIVDSRHYFLEEGQVCKSHYFVKKGCLRMFYHNKKGSEQITQFAIENWWLTDYLSITNQKPSEYYIQAVEPSEIIVIDCVSFEDLMLEVPILERYFRIMAERMVAASQFRLKLIHTLSKEEMYLHFNALFPAFTQRIPQYMVASYLGITPEYLSEIRRRNL